MQSSESHSANNSYISTSNRYRELSNNGDIENENNNGDYEKPTKAVDSNKTNSGKKNNYDTRKKINKSIIHRHQKTQQDVKKYDNVTVILGGSMVKDLKGWELSNNKQKVVVKSFRGTKTSHMHRHAKLTIEKWPENIIIYCGTNDISKDTDLEKITADIINLSKSVSEESGSNVIVSGLVLRKGYLNTKVRNINNKLRDYCGNRMVAFFKHDNINAETHCNIRSTLEQQRSVSVQ